MKALIFDLDGVVADTAALHDRSWQRLADEEGIPFGEDTRAALLGRTREDSLRLFAGDRDLNDAARANWLARKQAYFLEDLAAMRADAALPGVVDLLVEARGTGLATALASSSRNARAVIKRLGITDLFDVVADGTTVARPKPAPDIFLWVSDSLGVSPRDCVVFEDADAGVAAARAGGFAVVSVAPALDADATFASLEGVTLASIRQALSH